jgi:hypothetical protein
MRSLHSEASAHDQLGPFACAPGLTLTGTDGALSCSRRDSRLSTFLSPFPQNGFAPRSFSQSLRHGPMETLTAARLTPQAALPAYLATSSCRSVSNHVELPGHRYRHASVPSVFRTSPSMSRLLAAPRRIEFVCLRTDHSPPVALHLASQRRSYLWLRSLWHPPTRTFTMLMWHPHGRTHSGRPGALLGAHGAPPERCGSVFRAR